MPLCAWLDLLQGEAAQKTRSATLIFCAVLNDTSLPPILQHSISFPHVQSSGCRRGAGLADKIPPPAQAVLHVLLGLATHPCLGIPPPQIYVWLPVFRTYMCLFPPPPTTTLKKTHHNGYGWCISMETGLLVMVVQTILNASCPSPVAIPSCFSLHLIPCPSATDGDGGRDWERRRGSTSFPLPKIWLGVSRSFCTVL